MENINFKHILQQIEQEQIKTFVKVNDFKSKKGLEFLGTKSRGLYWLWTKMTNQDLKDAPLVKEKISHVPIAKLVTQREGVQGVCRITHNGYRLVYNGIGGYRTAYKSSGLRKRILQEFTCDHGGTGTLNVSAIDKGLNNWAVSFFDFDDKRNCSILNKLQVENPYVDFAKDFECLWRLEYGTPILCRH